MKKQKDKYIRGFGFNTNTFNGALNVDQPIAYVYDPHSDFVTFMDKFGICYSLYVDAKSFEGMIRSPNKLELAVIKHTNPELLEP